MNPATTGNPARTPATPPVIAPATAPRRLRVAIVGCGKIADQHVQAVLDRKFAKKHRKVRHDFAFARMIDCGHCGCSLVGEKKKGRYVYYRCSGYKGRCLSSETDWRCPEPYVREEVLAEKFAVVLWGLKFDEEVLAWVTSALKDSHVDERQFHDEAIARLQAEYTRLQSRIDGMYIDKLDGVVETDFYERKAAEWRTAQANIRRTLAEHETANQNYLDEGVRLLELANHAADLFENQPPDQKSGCSTS